MKLPSLFLALLFTSAISLHAEVSPVRMMVEQITKSETKATTGSAKPGSAKPSAEKTQVRSLNIRLDNNSTEAFDGLLVKYWFFGRDMVSRDTKLVASGERKSSLGPRSKELVESEAVSSSYAEEHYAVQGGGGNRGRQGAPRKVPASGTKITGYAVRVMKDDKVLAEYYSEPSYKAQVPATGK